MCPRTVDEQVLPRELALPGVRHRLAVGILLVAPREHRAVEPAARGELPLRLGWQILARPLRVGDGVFVRDVDHRMVRQVVERDVRTPRMTPARARHPGPPVRVVPEIDRSALPLEYHRTGDEVLRRSTGKVFGARWPLGKRHVARRLHLHLGVGGGGLQLELAVLAAAVRSSG
jgi:hypothetical protein